ncbi:MAG: cytochrome c3 family protein [Phycisphaerae bacterium]
MASSSTRFVFPRLSNYALPVLTIMIIGGALYVPVLARLAAHPVSLNVGYAPEQPIPYSHALHVGQLGIDCRYCHHTVEKSDFAAVPSTQTCMNCHTNIRGEPGTVNYKKLEPAFASWESGKPIEWIKIHDLADYSYFNHAAHVNKGVSCVSCHGRIDHMEIVWQDQPLNMGWCLECHRAPEEHLRPLGEVTNMGWDPRTHPVAIDAGLTGEDDREAAQRAVGLVLKEKYQIQGEAYMTSCSTCHR